MTDTSEPRRPERNPADPRSAPETFSSPTPDDAPRPRRIIDDEIDPRVARERMQSRAEGGRDTPPDFSGRSDRDPRDPRGRDPREMGRYPTPDEVEELDDSEYEEDDEPGGRWSFLHPKRVLPWFLAQPTKQKIIYGGIALVAVIVIISIIASMLSAITAPAAEEPAPEPTETISQPVQPEPTEPPPPPTPDNEWEAILSAEVGGVGITVDGMRIEIRDIECDIAAQDRNGEIIESELGSWCVTNFAAKNVSNDILTISTERFIILDIFGDEEYLGNYRYGDVGGGNAIVKLVPNESTAGFVYFEVPIGTQVSQLSFTTFGNVGGSPVIFENLPVRSGATAPEQQEGETVTDSVIEEDD